MRSILLALCVAVVAGLALSLSSCGPPVCTSNAQCKTAEACLPSGRCATSCTSDSQCRVDEKCSPSGGCVALAGGCGVDADCSGSQHGQYCHPGGICQATPPATTMDAHDAGPMSCGGEKFEAARTEANILIVLDHSGSMMEPISGSTTKWAAALDAVRTVTAKNRGIRFGMQMFSLRGQRCNAGRVFVPVGEGTAAAVSTALPAIADGNGTPIGGALLVAAQVPEFADTTRANYVMLITDGKENCGGNPVSGVEWLFSKNVRTYSVGFGSAIDAARLNEMAVKGGTARAGTTRYYQADNSQELETALTTIAQGALGCDFRLGSTPPDPAKLFVAIDGQFVPRDPARQSGWEYTSGANRVTLYGPACDAVTRNPGAKVSIVYGCPDGTLTETGNGGPPDSGYVFSLDGGEFIN